MTDMQHHIFMSYSRDDTEAMTRLRNDLRAAGFSVWTDEGILPGSPSWKVEIESAIRAAKCLVVLLSPDAAESRWVRAEIDFADTLSKPMFPVLVRGDETNAVPFGMSTYQWIDIRQAQNYDRGFKLLIDTMAAKLAAQPGGAVPDVVTKASKRKGIPRILIPVVAAVLIGLLVIASRPSVQAPVETPTALPESTPDELVTLRHENLSITAPVDWTGSSELSMLFDLIDQSAVDEAASEAFKAAVPEEDYRIFQANLTKFQGLAVIEQTFPMTVTINVLRLRNIPLMESLNTRIVEDSEVELPAGKALRLHLTSNQETVEGDLIIYYLLKGRTVYYIMFLVAEDNVDALIPQIEMMAESFRID